MGPLAVFQVLRPAERGAAIAARWTNPILLAPVVGAFLQILWRHQVPSILWPFLVLVAAVVTRILKGRAVVTERPASLGRDGLALAERFIAAPEIALTDWVDTVLWVTTKSGERLELRVDHADLDRAASTVTALEETIASPSRDPTAERVIADGPALRVRIETYREPALDLERCLAVAEDGAAAMNVRIAAAGLLTQGIDDTARVRVAAAAATTANPELREVLLEALARRASPQDA